VRDRCEQRVLRGRGRRTGRGLNACRSWRRSNSRRSSDIGRDREQEIYVYRAADPALGLAATRPLQPRVALIEPMKICIRYHRATCLRRILLGVFALGRVVPQP
jgi:hypothetical protein